MQPSYAGLVLVMREGATGRHWITQAKYDANPAAFELWSGPTALAPSPAPVADDSGGDMSALRAAYQQTIGKRPFPGWDADTLRQKIAAHPSGD